MNLWQKLKQYYLSNFSWWKILREVLISIIVCLIMKPFEEPKSRETDLVQTVMSHLKEADSIRYTIQLQNKQTQIDSLKNIILHHYEKDSMRTNAALSKLEALRAINQSLRQPSDH